MPGDGALAPRTLARPRKTIERAGGGESHEPGNNYRLNWEWGEGLRFAVWGLRGDFATRTALCNCSETQPADGALRLHRLPGARVT